jgi:hypothetical protein
LIAATNRSERHRMGLRREWTIHRVFYSFNFLAIRYCDIHKLAKQVADANEKKDDEKVNELLEKIDKLEKTLGPEYVALVEGIQDIAENDQLRAEFSSAFGALVRLCTR